MHKKELILHIKVEPRASRSGIVGPYGDGLKVRLTSPPLEGRANEELIKVLARAYGVSRNDIEILSGKKSKHKIVRITGISRKNL